MACFETGMRHHGPYFDIEYFSIMVLRHKKLIAASCFEDASRFLILGTDWSLITERGRLQTEGGANIYLYKEGGGRWEMCEPC